MSEQSSLPRENIIRAVMPGVGFRDSSEDGPPGPILFGHFSRSNEWAEINSRYEGHFLERFAPGAWKKTITENFSRLRMLFQHGQDPEVGDKPIAEILDVREDDEGAYYEARLFDGLPTLVKEGLRAGQYGSSHQFSVVRDREVAHPERSEHNPNGLPERTIVEAKLKEFGPVTWPAYKGATAGVRSLMDEFLIGCIRENPEGARDLFARALDLEDIASPKYANYAQIRNALGLSDITPKPEPEKEQGQEQDPKDAPSEGDAEPTEAHLTDERRDTKPVLLSLYGNEGRRRLNVKEQNPWHR